MSKIEVVADSSRFAQLRSRASTTERGEYALGLSRRALEERYRREGSGRISRWLDGRKPSVFSNISDDINSRVTRHDESVNTAVVAAVEKAHSEAYAKAFRRKTRKIDPRNAFAKEVYGEEHSDDGEIWITRILKWYSPTTPGLKVGDAEMQTA